MCYVDRQHGITNAVALMGSSLSARQADMLAGRLAPDGRVILLFDEDDAGNDCRRQCLDNLAEHIFVKSLRLPIDVAQPDSLTDEQIRQLL